MAACNPGDDVELGMDGDNGRGRDTAGHEDSILGLSDKEIFNIAEEISDEIAVRHLGIKLGLNWAQVDQFLKTNRVDGAATSKGTLHMLDSWRKKTPLANQRIGLRKALVESELAAIGEKHLRMDHVRQSPMTYREVEQCRRDLVQYYLEDASKIKTSPLDPDNYVELDKIHINLKLKAKENQPTTQKMAPIKYEDIMSFPSKLVMFVGEAGVGKTTFCAKTAYDWATGKHFQKINLPISILLSEVHDQKSLGEVVKQHLSDSNYVKEGQIDEYARTNPDKVLILLDELDEFSGKAKIFECQDKIMSETFTKSLLSRDPAVQLTDYMEAHTVMAYLYAMDTFSDLDKLAYKNTSLGKTQSQQAAETTFTSQTLHELSLSEDNFHEEFCAVMASKAESSKIQKVTHRASKLSKDDSLRYATGLCNMPHLGELELDSVYVWPSFYGPFADPSTKCKIQKLRLSRQAFNKASFQALLSAPSIRSLTLDRLMVLSRDEEKQRDTMVSHVISHVTELDVDEKTLLASRALGLQTSCSGVTSVTLRCSSDDLTKDVVENVPFPLLNDLHLIGSTAIDTCLEESTSICSPLTESWPELASLTFSYIVMDDDQVEDILQTARRHRSVKKLKKLKSLKCFSDDEYTEYTCADIREDGKLHIDSYIAGDEEFKKRRSLDSPCSSFLVLVKSLIHMIIALAILLAGSPVLVAGSVSTERITLQAGQPAVIPFDIPRFPDNISQIFPHFILCFESKLRPFFINGENDIEGFKSPSQFHRFTTTVSEMTSSFCVNVNIDPVDIVDEDRYVLQAFFHGYANLGPEIVTKEIAVQISPGPSKCFPTISENNNYPCEVHCHAATGSIKTTLTCYQHGQRVEVKGEITDNGKVTRAVFLLPDQSPFSCCSHDVTSEVNVTMCNDFEWPPSNNHISSPTVNDPNLTPSVANTIDPIGNTEQASKSRVESQVDSGTGKQYMASSVFPTIALMIYLFLCC